MFTYCLALLCVGHSQGTAKIQPLLVDRTQAMKIQIGGEAVCLVDIDNDGWTDICSATGIWHNDQGQGFTRVADGGTFVAADFDNDRFVDLFDYRSLRLWHNNRGKSFSEVPLPKLPPTVSRGACCGDFNGDGFVDLYIGGFEDWDKDITYPSFILQNKGGKGFDLIWQDNRYRTRGVTACDFNRDGNLDVYVSNYRLQPNQLWINSGKAQFHDGASEFNAVATSAGFDGGHSIGAAWGDFDNDGYMDLFAGNFAHRDSRGDQPKSRFLRNTGPVGKYKFDDKGTCGVFYQESYASPAAADFDNDGNLDLFFTTVYPTASFNTPNNPVLYRNESQFKFTDASKMAGLEHLGATYQAAWADFDHDGRIDLVTDGKIFINESAPKHWLEVRLHGDGKAINRSAIGAQVRVLLKDTTLTRQVEAGTGEGNQNDLTMHFGLGEIGGTMHIEIFWPNGKTEIKKHVRSNQIVDFTYGK